MKSAEESRELEEMLESRSSGNPASRLLDAARDLFYDQGYALAGINDIIAQSNTSKKSFYKYFPSKYKLGEAYLKSKTRDLIRFIDWLERRSRSYEHFCDLWSRSMVRIARYPDYNGCPFSNARAQAPEFHELIQDIHELYVLRLQELISRLCPEFNERMCHWIARNASMQYLGAVQIWKLSGSPDSFYNMGLLLRALPSLAPIKG